VNGRHRRNEEESGAAHGNHDPHASKTPSESASKSGPRRRAGYEEHDHDTSENTRAFSGSENHRRPAGQSRCGIACKQKEQPHEPEQREGDRSTGDDR
jgi:hypothetical protein